MINVVFCIPGKVFSYNFLKCWTNLLLQLPAYNVRPKLHSSVSSNVYLARDLCLTEKTQGGLHKKPFEGNIDYDYIMWIDSDSVFNPEDFKNILDQMEENPDLPILSALYFKDEGKEFSAVERVDKDHLEKYGTPKFLTPNDIKGKKELLRIEYNGLGFMMVRFGVYEKITYPWFQPVLFYHNHNVIGFASEDASFCLRAKEAGFDVWVDPKIIIGHEKSFVWK